ncbi:MAG: hypothetical protein NZM04_05870 [Methylacidiphilales bacterium]|nr:hypothetical protein [Candidatus Methylacidiphilales bacterium]MDW8350064.1 efflux RND transporter periplasmic adaptor subunit [Verrucomicrobiae bacterium]
MKKQTHDWRKLFIATLLTPHLFLSHTSETIHAHEQHTHHDQEEPWHINDEHGIVLSCATREALNIKLETVKPVTSGASPVAFTAQVREIKKEMPTADTVWLSAKFPSNKTMNLRQATSFSVKHLQATWPAVPVENRLQAQTTVTSEIILKTHVPPSTLRIGDFVEGQAYFSSDDAPLSVQIPSKAIIQTVRGAFVYVLQEDAFYRRQILTRAVTEDTFQVIEGLGEGDVVVTEGAFALWMIELHATNQGKGCIHAH